MKIEIFMRKISDCVFHLPLNLFVCTYLICLIAGCATIKEGFFTTDYPNLAPFADYTNSMISEAGYGFSERKGFLITKYLDKNNILEKKYLKLGNEAGRVFESFLEYSLNTVSLSETQKTEAEKIAKYGDHIDSFKNRILEKLGTTKEDYDVILLNIRKQKKLLSALKVAQPLINGGSRYSQKIFMEMEDVLFQISIRIESAIEADFTYVIHFNEMLKNRKKNILSAIVWIDAYAAGKKDVLSKLRENSLTRTHPLLVKKHLSENDLSSIESFLITRLDKVNALELQLADEMNLYQKTLQESDKIYHDELVRLSRARMSVIVWASAHFKMAQGKTDPAKWFDIQKAPGELIHIGKKAL